MSRAARLIDPAEFDGLLGAYRSLLPVAADVEVHLRGVLTDSLRHPGNMIRAQLTYGLLVQGGVLVERARQAAIGVEYFHTASLILDDLPSMDDAELRRGRPCPHRVYGEPAALLGALAFVNQGYALIWTAIADAEPQARQEAGDLLIRCLGPSGILNGQALDLHFGESSRSAEEVHRVAEGKTISLIRLTLGLSAILGEADTSARSRLDRLASGWGAAYQILDDFRDLLLSSADAAKTTRRDRELGRPNLPTACGTAGAWRRLCGLLEDAGRTVRELGDGGRWNPVVRMQSLLESESGRVGRSLSFRVCA